MTTPFTDNPKIALLKSLEDECAQRYTAHSRTVVELAEECRALREQRDRARNALRKLLAAYEDEFHGTRFTGTHPIYEAREALK